MADYSFNLIPPQANNTLADNRVLAARPLRERSLTHDAPRFVAGDALADAINTAIAIGEPLLLTGEPGTGKTQAAYYVAHYLGVTCFRFQVKSDSTARDLLYDFDTVRYFRDAHLQADDGGVAVLDKSTYLSPRPFWQAIAEGKAKGVPQVLLIDEIDKAPRDFPNDLLHELDQMEFTIHEADETISAGAALRPIVLITSNSERRLPAPFLRRCVYHHIEFTDALLRQAVESRKDELGVLSDDLCELAVNRFLELRHKDLRKKPTTAELLLWLRVLSLASGRDLERILKHGKLSELPHLGMLLKDHQDITELL
jgi:MoxR-like ATPase